VVGRIHGGPFHGGTRFLLRVANVGRLSIAPEVRRHLVNGALNDPTVISPMRDCQMDSPCADLNLEHATAIKLYNSWPSQMRSKSVTLYISTQLTSCIRIGSEMKVPPTHVPVYQVPQAHIAKPPH
jgi:hypothetical protein